MVSPSVKAQITTVPRKVRTKTTPTFSHARIDPPPATSGADPHHRPQRRPGGRLRRRGRRLQRQKRNLRVRVRQRRGPDPRREGPRQPPAAPRAVTSRHDEVEVPWILPTYVVAVVAGLQISRNARYASSKIRGA